VEYKTAMQNKSVDLVWSTDDSQ